MTAGVPNINYTLPAEQARQANSGRSLASPVTLRGVRNSYWQLPCKVPGKEYKWLTGGVFGAKGWSVVIPPVAWAGGLAAALAIGALAGLMPALRAARMSPTRALWSL
jgi:ABC-type antimicrobial peptide transport system permease subunit